MMTLFPLTDCRERLSVDPKTLRQWLKHSAMPLQAHPTDARVKCLTLHQVQQLACSHGRTLQPHQPFQSASGETTPPELASVLTSMQMVSPTCPSKADMHQQLDHPLAALSALLLPTELLPPCSPTLPQRQEVSQAEGGRHSHPAESRRRPLLPLIEYGARGSYVVICPRRGELPLAPDSPQWFAWLASLSSFRFVGKLGRFTAHRVYRKGPTRAWQAHRVIHQHHYKPYLGVTEHLTIDRLEQTAATLQSYAQPRSFDALSRGHSSLHLQQVRLEWARGSHTTVALSQEHLLRVGFPGSVLSTCSHKDTEALEPSHALSATVVSQAFPTLFPCFSRISLSPMRYSYVWNDKQERLHTRNLMHGK